MMDFTRLVLWPVVANFLIVLVSCAPSTCGESSVYFALMVSSAPTLNTSGVVSAVDHALGVVNRANSNVLPGVRLQYTSVLDTQCNRTRAIELFNENVSLVNQPVVAVLGGGCSSVTEEIAKASSASMPLISYASTLVTLSGRPNFFRTVPSDESLPPALATVMQYYGWRQVAIVTDREPQFLWLLPILNGSLSQAGISFVNHFTSEAVETIFEDDSRIFFLNMNPRPAIFYLCKAIEEGRQYPEYIWLTPGWYQEGWWREDEAYLLNLNCSLTSLEQQLERSLTLLAYPNNGDLNNITDETFNSNTYAMDAVMTLALALNEKLRNQNQTGAQFANQSLSDALQATMFTGASGSVKFNGEGNREDVVVFLQQFRVDLDGSLTPNNVAVVEEENFTYINSETNTTVWPGSEVTGIPPLIYVVNALKISIYAYVLSLVVIGVILSVICLVFNIVFRNRKVVKLTSPNLNYAIILGAVLLMVGNVFVPSPSTDLPMLAIFCPISRTFLSVGYDICFVVALVKTIRVAYIFWNDSPTKKKTMKDWQLLLLAAGIIAIEVAYTIPLLVLIHLNGDTEIIIDESRPPFTNDQGYTVVNRMIVCGNTSTLFFVYISLSYAFKLIIHIVGLILAFLTRKVKIDPLNDSRYSAILIYISFGLLIVSAIIILLVVENNTYAGVWTTFVLAEVCVFLGLNFIPKMVSLYRDPKGDNIFGEKTSTLNKSQLAASMTVRSYSINERTKFTASLPPVAESNLHH